MKPKIEVLVHAFDPAYDEQPRFFEARDNKVNGDSDLIILTCNPDRIKRILEGRKATIIIAEDYTARPIEGWTEYNKLLENYLEVVISGAELNPIAEKTEDRGCVYHAYEETSHPCKWIDISACWISSPSC